MKKKYVIEEEFNGSFSRYFAFEKHWLFNTYTYIPGTASYDKEECKASLLRHLKHEAINVKNVEIIYE